MRDGEVGSSGREGRRSGGKDGDELSGTDSEALGEALSSSLRCGVTGTDACADGWLGQTEIGGSEGLQGEATSCGGCSASLAVLSDGVFVVWVRRDEAAGRLGERAPSVERILLEKSASLSASRADAGSSGCTGEAVTAGEPAAAGAGSVMESWRPHGCRSGGSSLDCDASSGEATPADGITNSGTLVAPAGASNGAWTGVFTRDCDLCTKRGCVELGTPTGNALERLGMCRCAGSSTAVSEGESGATAAG